MLNCFRNIHSPEFNDFALINIYGRRQSIKVPDDHQASGVEPPAVNRVYLTLSSTLEPDWLEL